ncbi:conserved hypothetical protein [uncultured Eubacteriales bacterium]|uniref:N-acetyltransferase domain-containing protein n=1 Tax=uncultured Eubacteriales bacterium TaxID=172733 RepID=A0A212K7I6_9FIRM|nr:conserved hypothetical protein [uncultured Eubacteriales bacterium]
MLDHIHEKVDIDPKSIGIDVDMENPENVKLYKHLGYKELGNLTIYCMFRPKCRQKS